MEKHIDSLYNERIKNELAERFGVSGLNLVGDVENYVYECQTANGTRRILRITHESPQDLR